MTVPGAKREAFNGISRVTPDDWAERLSGPADILSDRETWSAAFLRHWTGTSPDMDQPPLDHHYIVQHLGGPKHVERKRDGASISTVVDLGALTVVPAGTRFHWHTRGPIEFAHLYLSPALLESTALRLDRASDWSLIDRVGLRDPLLEALYDAMLQEIRESREAHALYLDCLLDSFVLRLLRQHSTAKLRTSKPRERLTAFRLARVVEFVDAHLDQQISLADLVKVAGGSVFHFCRAFKNTMGETPYQFALRRRIERAKSLLATTSLPLAHVARACGFRDSLHLSRTFSRAFRTTPSHYRRHNEMGETEPSVL
jgi:AraC family transcriptional regulator